MVQKWPKIPLKFIKNLSSFIKFYNNVSSLQILLGEDFSLDLELTT